jgi:pyruvate-ferredoxin/flavodoxin oxidoreductase
MKDAAYKSYSKKGDAIVQMNYKAIEAGAEGAVKIDIPADWATTTEGAVPADAHLEGRPEVIDYVKKIQQPINAQRGNQLPVSAFVNDADGTVPQGTAAYEKRGVAVDVPQWIPENCIQCNICSYVCPHSVIRPVAMTEEEAAAAPAQMQTIDIKQLPGMKFNINVSVLDCTGCGSCVEECPAKNKALVMKSLESQLPQQEVFDYAQKVGEKADVVAKFNEKSVKGSQFKQPLFEFSGACAGCGETPYAKLATQLFGDRMMIANATGCSSIWAGSTPSTPYTVNKAGKGPSWANSLFEDNAEFGLGMELAQKAVRGRLIQKIEEIAASDKASAEMKAACEAYLSTKDDSDANRAATADLIAQLEQCGCDKAKEILADKDYLAKKSVWILGGDGWAYDIGFSGLDHAIATGENINILVFDTEVYSNTGGQSSKASPMGSVAQFAAAGKATKKKDLAAIAMSYGNVYVASIAMGADRNQCLKAFVEAESYNGPSVIIAYAPCISHGIKGGLRGVQAVEKRAVASGYWKLFRNDPRRIEQGLNPFQLDSKEPSESFRDFLMSEVRYNSLTRAFPDRAEALFTQAEKNAAIEYHQLKAKADADLVQ